MDASCCLRIGDGFRSDPESILLVEGGRARDRVDRVLVVDADEAAQLERLQTRDGCSLEQARAILASQASRKARLAAADDVLSNVGSVADLRQGVDRLHEQYLQMAETWPNGPI